MIKGKVEKLCGSYQFIDILTKDVIYYYKILCIDRTPKDTPKGTPNTRSTPNVNTYGKFENAKETIRLL